jgi:hypothetical protein
MYRSEKAPIVQLYSLSLSAKYGRSSAVTCRVHCFEFLQNYRQWTNQPTVARRHLWQRPPLPLRLLLLRTGPSSRPSGRPIRPSGHHRGAVFLDGVTNETVPCRSLQWISYQTWWRPLPEQSVHSAAGQIASGASVIRLSEKV